MSALVKTEQYNLSYKIWNIVIINWLFKKKIHFEKYAGWDIIITISRGFMAL